MSGRPKYAATMDVVLTVRLSVEQAQALDSLRGRSTRSAYIRRLLTKETMRGTHEK